MSKSITKDLSILTVGRALQVVALFLNYKLLALYLEPTQVGVYFLMLAVASYFGLVLINPVGTYLNRHLHKFSNENVLIPFLLLFLVYLFITHLLGFLALLALSPWFQLSSGNLYWVTLFATFYSFAASLGNTIVPSLNILNHRVAFVVLTVLTHLVGLALSLVLVTQFGLRADFWLLGLGLSYFFFGLIGLFMIRQRTSNDSFSKVFQVVESGLILRFGAPIALTNICLWLITQAYRPITEQFSSLEFLGYAGFGLGLASTLSVTFEYLLQQLYFPDLYKNINTDQQSQRESSWNDSANRCLFISLSLAIFVSSLSPVIISFSGSEKYKPAIYFLSIGIWAETFRAIGNIFSLIGQSELKTSKTIIPYFAGGIVTVALLFASQKGHVFESFLPFALIVGHLTVCTGLYFKFKGSFHINIHLRRLTQQVLWCLLFLLVIPLYGMSQNLIATILILGVFGLYLLFIQLKAMKRHEA